ncbi:MAG: cation transporter [Acidimicrobiia bacterium]
MGDPTMVIAVEGMHCPSCGLLVDEVVEEVAGVVSSATDVRTGRTVVTVGGDVDPVTVVAAIDGAGYAARVLP